MKDVAEFEKTMVNIDFCEGVDCYGHYPFQLFAETKDGQFEVNALALGQVAEVYHRAKSYREAGAKRIYLSLDFPAIGDMENDFVVIISTEDDKSEIYAITYNSEDGEIIDRVEKADILDRILGEYEGSTK